MKNILKISVALVICAVSSLNAAAVIAQPQAAQKAQPKAMIAMATVPTTYGQDSNVY